MKETIRCPHCALNQFMTLSGKCRKCHKLFVEPPPFINLQPMSLALALVPPLPVFAARPGSSLIEKSLPPILKMLRLAKGLSQREFANLLDKPRTYVSKYENGKALPTVKTLLQIAKGLDVPAMVIIQMAEAA